jgi:predicted TIM-barrel enzyme
MFTRKEILERLKKTIDKKRPILGAGCSAGIIAKCAEMGGADLILVYSTGKSRLMGLPTTYIGDSNSLTLDMMDEITNVVDHTPIIAGVEAKDLTHRNLKKLVESFIESGCSGIINFPTVGIFPKDFNRVYWEAKGQGFDRETRMIEISRDMDIFTMAYVFDAEDAKKMIKAGVDIIVTHAGWTTGGLSGAPEIDDHRRWLLDTSKRLQSIANAAKEIKPDLIWLVHGGPIATPADTLIVYSNTDALGFVGASSIERIPVEKAVIDVVKSFKNQFVMQN